MSSTILVRRCINMFIALKACSRTSLSSSVRRQCSPLGTAVTHFSRSTIENAIFGITFPAKSSLSKISTVAINAIRPATLAWTNGSFKLRANAGTRTFFFVFGPRMGASRPRRIHVFVRMEGSVSVCILARRRRRSLFNVRSLS